MEISVVELAIGMQNLRAYVAMVRQKAVGTFGIAIMYAIVGRENKDVHTM